MKTAEEYLPESDLAFEGGIELILKSKVVALIEQAQKEAYNEALIDKDNYAREEAERWRDADDLPEETGFYLCECYNSVGNFYEVLQFTGYWRGSKVRKWKPIK